ncbi:MAG: hypothetical protein DRN12_02570 [Thermoplasmata archaeon]|nr:MAG: hypothetical protein DRN12_02570 [Thermoplasmata archaeon]
MNMKSRIIPIIIVSFILLIPISMSHKFLSNEEKSNLANKDPSITMSNPNNDGEWNHTYSDSYLYHNGYCVHETSDGGYIIAGEVVLSNGISDRPLLIKTEDIGNLIWMKTFGHKNSDASYVEETNDGGYILVGTYYGSSWDMRLIKTDRDGNLVWDKILGTLSDETGECVHQTSDDGYILCGSTSGDVWLVKTDDMGNIVWDKSFNTGSFAGGAESLQQTSDGGYILVGYAISSVSGEKSGDVLLIKTDNQGNMLWKKYFGGKGCDEGHWVEETRDGGFIIVGEFDRFGCDDIWLIKTDSEGNMVWNKSFGGGSWDEAYCVKETIDEGYIIVGGTYSYSRYGDEDLWLIKTDQYGNKEWGRILGGSGYDGGHFVDVINDGSYIVVGGTSSFISDNRSEVWLLKIVPDNKPPSKPIVTGSSTAKINKPYTINISSVDPEDDDIYYFVVAWGIGVSGWIGPYQSGETVSFTVFTHAPRGVYNITVKAIDSHGWESVMSDPLRVTFPKPFSLNLLPPFIQRMLLSKI